MVSRFAPQRAFMAPRAGLALLALVVIAGALAPEPVPHGLARLAALAVAVCGAALLVGRLGAADLATAAAMAAGAYGGGVAAALTGLPVLAGVPAGALAGAAVGAASAALHGRVGRPLGALTSLALGGGLVAAVAAWPAGGGVAGFHAVGLLTTRGSRVEAVVLGVALLAAVAVTGRLSQGPRAARASLAVRAPVVAAAQGHRPAVDAAVTGAAAGALLAVGGVLLAAVDGSVFPAAYGLGLAAALALAGLVGGGGPLGPVVGALLVWGPGTIWPLVPLVGTAPPLLVAGPVGLALLAWRGGRPLVPWSGVARGGAGMPGGDGAAAGLDGAAAGGTGAGAGARSPSRPCTLRAGPLPTPAGPVTITVEPGEVVALVGPNGAGKSTLLARVAGQLPDAGAVRLGDGPAPRGAVARARAGIARTWQRPPQVPAADLVGAAVAAGGDPGAAGTAARWAAATLTGDEVADALDGLPPGVAQLVALAARGPALALLDEPTDVAPDRLRAFVRGLAAAGTGVLLVDHRPEVVSAADRQVVLHLEGRS